jgi:hypothetical protein
MAQVLHCNIVNIRAAAVDCRQLSRAPTAGRFADLKNMR